MKAPLPRRRRLLVLALAGCSGLRSQAPETVSYLLRARNGRRGEFAFGAAAAHSLKVVRVVAQPGYDGDRIPLLGADRSPASIRAAAGSNPARGGGDARVEALRTPRRCATC